MVSHLQRASVYGRNRQPRAVRGATSFGAGIVADELREVVVLSRTVTWQTKV